MNMNVQYGLCAQVCFIIHGVKGELKVDTYASNLSAQ